MTWCIEVLRRQGFTHLHGFDCLLMDQASSWLSGVTVADFPLTHRQPFESLTSPRPIAPSCMPEANKRVQRDGVVTVSL